jgi:GNAT superfamily N-acetyltransferase
VLARAFHDDPAWRWILPSARRRERILPWLFERVLASADADVDVTDDLAGAAVWIDSATPPRSPGLGAVVGIALRFRGAQPRLRAYLELNARLKDEVHPAPCLVLSGIGVVPERQGQGLGTALLAAGLARADRAALPVFLTTCTERNLPLYERHGFAVEALRAPPGGPPTWAMVRLPR